MKPHIIIAPYPTGKNTNWKVTDMLGNDIQIGFESYEDAADWATDSDYFFYKIPKYYFMESYGQQFDNGTARERSEEDFGLGFDACANSIESDLKALAAVLAQTENKVGLRTINEVLRKIQMDV